MSSTPVLTVTAFGHRQTPVRGLRYVEEVPDLIAQSDPTFYGDRDEGTPKVPPGSEEVGGARDVPH